jgi:hypothetical protein
VILPILFIEILPNEQTSEFFDASFSLDLSTAFRLKFDFQAIRELKEA